MPPPGGSLFAEIDPLLPPPLRDEYQAYLTEYLDFHQLFARTETEASRLYAKLGRFYAEAARARGFTVPLEPPEETDHWSGFEVLKNAGHRPFADTPKPFAEVVGKFLDRLRDEPTQ